MEANIEPVLEPLRQYSTQIMCNDARGVPIIGGYGTNMEVPTIDHAEFISKYVHLLIPGAVERFGREAVINDLVEVALPAYDTINAYCMAMFWRVTLEGTEEEYGSDRPQGARNADLAAIHGIKPIYGPILDLGMMHQATKVFSNTSKYFSCHGVRMGPVITRFGLENFLTYIEYAKRLLQHGVYDWSIEHNPDQWEALAPAIEKHGFGPVLSVILDPKCALGDIPGTKDYKYKYSFFGYVFWGLAPYLLPRLLEGGPAQTRQDLQPVVEFVRELHSRGAFAVGTVHDGKAGSFFHCFREHLPLVQKQGIAETLEIIRPHWEGILLSA